MTAQDYEAFIIRSLLADFTPQAEEALRITAAASRLIEKQRVRIQELERQLSAVTLKIEGEIS